MKSLLAAFAAGPPADRIGDGSRIDALYRRHRFRVLVAITAGYALAYTCRLALSVVKKRGSRHERSIREFRLDDSGIRVGEPLRDFRGILTGVPVYEGSEKPRRNTRGA